MDRRTKRSGWTTYSVPLRRFKDAYYRRQYAVLFFSLLLSFAVGPLLSTLHLNLRIFELFFLVNLLLAGMGTGRRMRTGFLAVVLAVAALRVIGALGGFFELAEGSAFAFAFLVLIAAVKACRHALGAREADAEHLYAALSAYLLAGFFFGIVAATLEQVAPGSYTGIISGGTVGISMPEAFYFSFVTLATLGYGDIVPRTDLARGLAIMEAVAGQLYIAVLVARLVAVSVSKKIED